MINNSKLTIIIAVFTISFIGYNVLTVDASTLEKEDIRKMKFVNDDLDDYGLKHIAIEQACKDTGGQWKDNNWCKFDKDKTGDEVEFEHQLHDRGLSYFYGDMKEAIGGDEEFDKYEQERYEKSQKGVEEYEKYVAKQEEIAAKEDALCDNEDAETTNIEICSSQDLILVEAFAEKYNKENCENHNGEWIDGKCDFYENQMKEGWEVDEDNFYKEVCDDAVIVVV